MNNVEYCKFYETLHTKFKLLEFAGRPNRFSGDYPATIWKEIVDNDDVPIARMYFGCNEQYFYKPYPNARSNFDRGEENDVSLNPFILYRALKYIGDGVHDSKARVDIKKRVDTDDWGDWDYEVHDLLKQFFQNHPPEHDEFSINKQSNDDAKKAQALAAAINKSQGKTDEISENDIAEKAIEGEKLRKEKGISLGTVPSRIDDFIGRTEEFENLNKILSETKKIVFIHGVPGIGKTSFVKAFIHEHKDHFDHIAWISVDSAKDELPKEKSVEDQSRLEAAFQPLYRFLNPNKQQNDGLNIGQRYTDTIAQLNSREGDNLLIVDNCDSSILKLQGILHWKILATGRYKVTGTQDILLDALIEEDAIRLFHKFCERTTDEDLLKKFLQEIDRHTLMIEVAAKTLNESGWLTLEDLYERLLKGRLEDQELDQEIATEYGADGELIKHLLLLFDTKLLSEEEIKILKTWYYLRPSSYAAEDISNFTAIPLQDGDLKTFLTNLSKKGWIVFNSNNRTYSMHRLVQKTILYALLPKIEDVQSLFVYYEVTLSVDEFKTNSLIQILGNCEYLIGQAQSFEIINPILIAFLVELTCVYHTIGLYEKCIIFLEKIEDVFDKLTISNRLKLGVDRVEISAMFGHIFFCLGKYHDAEEKLLEALKFDLLGGSENQGHWENRKNIYFRLILIYSERKDKETAKLYLEKLRDYVGGGNSPLDRTAQERIVSDAEMQIFHQSEDYDSAKPIADKLFKEYTQEYENKQMDSADYALRNIEYGSLMYELNKFDEALSCYHFAYNILAEIVMKNSLTGYDIYFHYLHSHISELMYKTGDTEGLKQNEMSHWKLCKKRISFEPSLWKDMITLSLAVAKSSVRPIPSDIIKMVRTSLAVVFAYCPDKDDQLKYIRLTKEILGCSEKDFRKFIDECNIESHEYFENGN
jgi:hypothetical protein